MSARRAFRPGSPDALEARVVLNAHMPAAHAVATFGVLGDSYSDEYQFYSPARVHARNWVEQLATAHRADFGAFTRASRGEPRDQGYARDWARSDATSTDMIANQLPGLTRQVANGEVKYAAILVGGNDFLHYAESLLVHPPTSPSAIPAGLATVAATATRNIETAVSTLLAANPDVKVAVATIPTLGLTPLAQALSTTPQGKALVGAFDGAIGGVNAQLWAIAASNPRVAFVDIAGTEAGLAQGGTSTRFGGTTITLTTMSDDYHSFLLSDGIHAGTVGQGVIANLFVGAIDAKFGATIRPFTPAQIVQTARQIQAQTRRLH